ncbi:holo-[acyl-carrier-protein] synthase [Dissulfurispira thermophila]|uniref:Holo-[acyl-carrier-protein] synthase n=2 Tax=root TaxID=1 RepID=A0A7G1H043_9BACT|nr:holo-ACP synthase [Dissulfurispira thermophila]BCB96145.1 holo-[acyl-carrier-protein] synthase [Dissulfurispira thermophila]
MIVGIGTDIVEISRIKHAVEKWGKRFLKKIFTEKEISYCYRKKDPFPHLAVRFAAKEAVIKALSSEDRGIKIGNLRSIEILNHPTGKPCINLLENLEAFFEDKFIIHLTLSHERSYAIATVVLERKN